MQNGSRMMSIRQTSHGARIALLATMLVISEFDLMPAKSAENVIYSFQGGTDGNDPIAGLLDDSSGYFYGATSGGGGGGCLNTFGCGTIFSLTPQGAETVLYAFQGGADGAFPDSNLFQSSDGSLYGTTQSGGNGNNCGGCGTVFKVTLQDTETIVYAFQGGSDGAYPVGGVIGDGTGGLFGTTGSGGNFNGSECASEGCGTVFDLNPDGTKATLYAFQGGSDGAAPWGVIRDASGNLYGATADGGTDCDGQGIGCGTVFKVQLNGTETVLHSFQGGSDGSAPSSGPISDTAGSLYGTTVGGGGSGCGGSGCGTVFKISSGNTETVLYAFKGGTDGEDPEAGLVMDKSGNLYGTTYFGGSTGCKKTGGIGCGTVFKVAPDGTGTVLYAFRNLHGGAHGLYPAANLLLKGHNLYGTTTAGGANKDGVVFSLRR